MRLSTPRAALTKAVAIASAVFLVLTVTPPSPASAQGQLAVTLPDGSTPKELLTDTTLVPGSTTEETLIVSQNTDESVKTGVRFESQSPHGPLHDDADLTIDGLGSSTTVPLGEGLDAESPFWLGSLSPDDEATITISVHLPESSGNDTQREQARFRIIVTAQGEGGTAPTPTSSPTPTDSPTDPSDASSDEDSTADGSSDAGSSADADDSSAGSSASSADTSTDSRGSAETSTSADASVSADSTSSADADGSSDPGGDLPRTGANVFAALLLAAGLLAAGTFAVRTARKRSSSSSRDS